MLNTYYHIFKPKQKVRTRRGDEIDHIVPTVLLILIYTNAKKQVIPSSNHLKLCIVQQVLNSEYMKNNIKLSLQTQRAMCFANQFSLRVQILMTTFNRVSKFNFHGVKKSPCSYLCSHWKIQPIIIIIIITNLKNKSSMKITICKLLQAHTNNTPKTTSSNQKKKKMEKKIVRNIQLNEYFVFSLVKVTRKNSGTVLKYVQIRNGCTIHLMTLSK